MRETQIVGWMIIRWMGEEDQWESHEVKIEALDGIPVEDEDKDAVIEYLLDGFAQRVKPNYDEMFTVLFHGEIICQSYQSMDDWESVCTPELLTHNRKWSFAETQDYYDGLDEEHEPC